MNRDYWLEYLQAEMYSRYCCQRYYSFGIAPKHVPLAWIRRQHIQAQYIAAKLYAKDTLQTALAHDVIPPDDPWFSGRGWASPW